MDTITLSDLMGECSRLRVSPRAEMVDVGDTVGRTLAADVRALAALPQADTAACGGLALRANDTPGFLRVTGAVAPGHASEVAVVEGTAVRVAAGSRLPAGADAVVPFEQTGSQSGLAEVRGDHEAGECVRRAGEIIMQGVLMLHAGMTVPATAVAAMAAVGHARIPVLARPRVAIVGIGDGLLPLGARVRPWQRIDANPVGLAAQVRAAGGVVASTMTVPDDRDAVVTAIEAAMAGDADLVTTVGGDSPFAPSPLSAALKHLGATAVADGLAVDPCQSLRVAAHTDATVLCLPGDPVSAAVGWQLVGLALLGRPPSWEYRARLGSRVPTTPGVLTAVRCIMRGGVLHPLALQASHAVTTLALADALAIVDPEAPADADVPWSPLR